MLYAEIWKLKAMLDNAEIPFVIRERWSDIGPFCIVFYPSRHDSVCTAVQYANIDDTLCFRGLFTPQERKRLLCMGMATAEEMFERIKNHYEINGKGE